MAYFEAFEQFDLISVNLNWYDANLDDSGLNDNSYVTVGDQVYEDQFYVDGYDGYNWLELVFLGSGISQDLTGAVVAGTQYASGNESRNLAPSVDPLRRFLQSAEGKLPSRAWTRSAPAFDTQY